MASMSARRARHLINAVERSCKSVSVPRAECSSSTTTPRPPPSSHSSRAPVTLSKAMQGLPSPVYTTPPKHSFAGTELSTLPSGLRVVTEPKFGNSATIGVLIDAGSRYESAYPSGVCHLLEKLAFNSTLNYPSGAELFGDFEKYGTMWDAQASKDLFIYASNVHLSGVQPVMKLIADNVLRLNITDEELHNARQVVSYDTEAMNTRPEVEPILMDWIHQAAYRGNTLGLPKICPPGNAEAISREQLFSYMSQHFTPERMVVVGIGTDHQQLLKMADEYFVQEKSIWAQNPDLLPATIPEVDNSIAQWTGGILKIERDLSQVGAGTPYPNLAHLVLGFESCGFKDEDYVPFSVLNALMGGGYHFSSGGPGKGMYTRLYTNVLNHHHWMYNATCYNHAYADSGLFCIHASADPCHMQQLSMIITDQMLRMPSGFNKMEVGRAKSQLKSLLLMNLEMRPVQFEDTGRMIVGLGYRKSPMTFIEEIEQVTESDLMRCADRLLASKPAVLGYGDLQALPGWEQFDQAVANRSIDHLQTQKQTSRAFWK